MNPLAGISGELFDVDARLDAGKASSVSLDIRGTPIIYNAADNTLSCLGTSVRLDGSIREIDLRVLVDRTSLEIFAARGRFAMSFCFRPGSRNLKLALTAQGGPAIAKSVYVREISPRRQLLARGDISQSRLRSSSQSARGLRQFP